MENNAVLSKNETPSLPISWSLEDSWTHTKVKVLEINHKWRIDNFSFLCQKPVAFLYSAPFWAIDAKIKWHLILNLDSNANLVMMLRFENLNDQARAKYRLIIYDGTKKEAKVVSKMHFFNNNSYCVSEVMCSLNDIFSADKKILSDDELTVGCEVKYVHSIVEWPGSSNTEFINSKLRFNNLKLMFETQKLSDVKINIGDRTFEAHKTILAAASPVFLAMFENNMTETIQNSINIDDVDEETFEEMLHFIYTGNVKNIEKVVYTLFAAADKYAIDKLKQICQKQLCESLAVDNAVKVLILADLHSAVELKEKVIEFMRIRSVDVTKTEDFNSMINSHHDLLAETIRALTIK